MSMRYYDSLNGSTRFKRRYVWAFWAYAAGMASATVVQLLLG